VGHGLSGVTKVWILNSLLVLATAVGFLLLRGEHDSVVGSFHVPLVVLTGLFLAAEVFVVHLEFQRNAHSVALGEIPLIVGLFFASPTELLLAQLIGAGVALVVHRRQSLLKLVFNLSHFCFESVVAIVIFRAIVSMGSPTGVAGWGAAFSATIATTMIGIGAVVTAIALSEGGWRFEKVGHALGIGTGICIANSGLGLIAAALLWTSMPWMILLLTVPLGMLFIVYRAYTREHQRHSSLEFLYESTRVLQDDPEADAGIAAVLESARRVLRAERAELVLLIDGELRRSSCGHDHAIEAMSVLVDEDFEEVMRMCREEYSLLFSTGTDRPIPEYLRKDGADDAMLVGLRGEEKFFGVLSVINRSGDVSTFDPQDLRLFETLAQQVTVFLEKGRLEKSLAQLTELEQRLKYQAFHDPLTGLANRALFTDRVEHALALKQRNGESLGVLFIDLDDFKTINDSLGHLAGDQMLVEAAARLERCLRPGDTAARLGGDEFAILLENMNAPEVSVAVSQRVIGALLVPFTVQGKSVTIRASIGIAVADGGQIVADDLIRNADLAMYRAKEEGNGSYQLFRQSMHRAAIERLELIAELQRAVDLNEFVVHYQPIVSLDSGDVYAVEALVRWDHPERGMVDPDEFVPMAEDTGLIVPMGRWILEEACRSVVGWQASHPDYADMQISVNLSPRQFSDPNLIETVVDILERTGLDAECLILEITEGVVMQDTEAAAETLRTLGSLGVKLAIDDFGTGFSSLSYLRRMPVDVLKIARPFVDDLVVGGQDESLVTAIVQLGKTLGLRTIAEGIENPDQLWALKGLGCDFGQGHLFSPAIPVDNLHDYLVSRTQLTSAEMSCETPERGSVRLVKEA
jgi:diguanylate cyclase (GGDEF)-like protein